MAAGMTADRQTTAIGIAVVTLILALAFLPVGLAVAIGLAMVPIVRAVQ